MSQFFTDISGTNTRYIGVGINIITIQGYESGYRKPKCLMSALLKPPSTKIRVQAALRKINETVIEIVDLNTLFFFVVIILLFLHF